MDKPYLSKLTKEEIDELANSILNIERSEYSYTRDGKFKVSPSHDNTMQIEIRFSEVSGLDWVPDRSHHIFINDFETTFACRDTEKFYFNYMRNKFPKFEKDYFSYNKHQLLLEYMDKANDIEIEMADPNFPEESREYYKDYKKDCMEEYLEDLKELKNRIEEFKRPAVKEQCPTM